MFTFMTHTALKLIKNTIQTFFRWKSRYRTKIILLQLWVWVFELVLVPVQASVSVSLFKDVIIRLGRAGVKGKSDDVILYDGFFLTASLIDYGCIKWQTNIISYMDVIWYDQIRCQFSMTSQLILSYFWPPPAPCPSAHASIWMPPSPSSPVRIWQFIQISKSWECNFKYPNTFDINLVPT